MKLLRGTSTESERSRMSDDDRVWLGPRRGRGLCCGLSCEEHREPSRRGLERELTLDELTGRAGPHHRGGGIREQLLERAREILGFPRLGLEAGLAVVDEL